MIKDFIAECKRSQSFKKSIGSLDIKLSFIKNCHIYIDNNTISIDNEYFCVLQEELKILILKWLETLNSEPYNKGLKTLCEFEILCFIQDNRIRTNFYTDKILSVLDKMKTVDKIRDYISILCGYGLNNEMKKIFLKYKVL